MKKNKKNTDSADNTAQSDASMLQEDNKLENGIEEVDGGTTDRGSDPEGTAGTKNGLKNSENKENIGNADEKQENAGDTEDGKENSEDADEQEKLLFRDTTPELVENAVYSLNRQGLLSVQCREEEDTWAVYASQEEFEKARELLIEILKDEADNISERARTLEAKRTLRKMEITELAPGFTPEKTPKEKYEDANSTAAAFLLVGVLGILFIVLEYFGIFFSLGLADNVKYIFYPTMLAMFAVFLIVGFVNKNQAAKWKVEMYEEDRIMNNVREFAEHELVRDIRAMMAQRVVNEVNEMTESSVMEERPDPEDALAQLENMFAGGFRGEATAEAQEDAEEKDVAKAQEETGDEATAEAQEETGDEATAEMQEDGAEAEAQDEKSGTEAEDEAADAAQKEELDRVFNNYYVMEQEIHLRLLKEFPDLPANLLLEATEYVINLVEARESGEEETSEDTDAADILWDTGTAEETGNTEYAENPEGVEIDRIV